MNSINIIVAASDQYLLQKSFLIVSPMFFFKLEAARKYVLNIFDREMDVTSDETSGNYDCRKRLEGGMNSQRVAFSSTREILVRLEFIMKSLMRVAWWPVENFENIPFNQFLENSLLTGVPPSSRARKLLRMVIEVMLKFGISSITKWRDCFSRWLKIF